jgi:hypothetical protein
LIRLLDNSRVILYAQISQAPMVTLVKSPQTVTVDKWSRVGRRSAQTTNTERRLVDLETAVVSGLMTAGEAERLFGHKPIGSPGRARAAGQEDFASWLRTRIRKLSDDAALDAMLAEVSRLQDDRTLPRPKRVAKVRELNRQIGARDPEYVARLRAALAELYDAATTGDTPRRQKLAAAA